MIFDALSAITDVMNHSSFPSLIKPERAGISFEETLAFFRENQQSFKSQLHESGALLLRGFPLEDASAFSQAVLSLNLGQFMDYKGGDSPRKKVAEGVYTSTEAPPWLKIPLHNELSYSKQYPSHIFFFCDIPCTIRGTTPIADARKVLQSIDPEVRKTFTEKGLLYRSAYHGGTGIIPRIVGKGHRSWQDSFETANRDEVERICKQRGITYRWTDDNWLVIEEVCRATITHPETGVEVWFNQAHLFKLSRRLLGFWRYLATQILYSHPDHRFHDVFFSDGDPIPYSMLEHIRDKLDEHSISFPWQKGDLLVLDNYLSMHGRDSFEGKRRILTSMTVS